MTKEALTERITAYLSGGGLFNSELADHVAVRDLLIECRDALAQPEQEKERCVGCEACIDTACGRDECPKGWPKAAQPEQKPFAWYAIEHGEADIEWNSQRPIYEGNWKPLYRTPPQRKPLTDEQIETLWPLRPTDEIVAFARAIEAAHGIKGEA